VNVGAAGFFRTLVTFYYSTWGHIPVDSNLKFNITAKPGYIIFEGDGKQKR
jgi:hypothetical protein